MSNPERPYSDKLKTIEESETFTKLMESWDMFMWHQDILHSTIREAMAGNAGDDIDEAKNIVYQAKDDYMKKLRDLTIVIFDTIDHDEAIDVWSNMMSIAFKERLHAIRSIDVRASFDLTPMAEIRAGAQYYAEGRLMARRDDVLDQFDANEEIVVKKSEKEKSFQTHEGIGPEHIHEITQDEIDWDDPTQFSEGDEYNQWVLDGIEEQLEDHIDELFDHCPPDLYDY